MSNSSATPWTVAHQGSSLHGISQARILGRVAISFSRGSSQPRDQAHVSCSSCTGRQNLCSEPSGKPRGEIQRPMCLEAQWAQTSAQCSSVLCSPGSLCPSALTLAWCFIVSLPIICLMNWDLAQTGGSALKLMSISLYGLPTFFLQLAAPLSSEGVGTGRRD